MINPKSNVQAAADLALQNNFKTGDNRPDKLYKKIMDKTSLNRSASGQITNNVKTDRKPLALDNGMVNINTGTREVFRHDMKQYKKNPLINEGTTMSTITIPIKQLILEEGLTEHIQNNASKYAGGALLGAGALAGKFLADGNLDLNLNHDSGDTSGQHVFSKPQQDTRSDFQKDLGNLSSTERVDYHNQDKGIIGNISGAINNLTDNVRAENKFNNVAGLQKDYEEAKNAPGELLSTGQMIGGGALLSAAALAKIKSRKR